jgi:hypothetical protein
VATDFVSIIHFTFKAVTAVTNKDPDDEREKSRENK